MTDHGAASLDEADITAAVEALAEALRLANQAVADAEADLARETAAELETRYDNQLFTAYNYLWSMAAVEADDTVDPPIAA